MLAEYERTLGSDRIRVRHGYSEGEIHRDMLDFRMSGFVVNPEQSLQVIDDDPDDNIVLECAVAGEVGYIVTGDVHLLALGEYEGVKIIRPRAFLDDVPDAGRTEH